MLRNDKQNVKSIPISNDNRDANTFYYNAKVALEQGDIDAAMKSVAAAKEAVDACMLSVMAFQN